jgi:hypothetical protein
MIKFVVFSFLLLTLKAFAVDFDLSGNLEGQMRHAENNDMASDPPLYQDWTEEDFYLVYGNLNGKIEMGESRFEANWFGRYAHSDLFNAPPLANVPRGPYVATNIYLFPNRLVARDMFQLQDVRQEGSYLRESIINKLYYEWDAEDSRIMLGRMYVNYGLGEIFNPINPFNQPTGLTSINQIAQGNDGLSFTYFVTDKHSIQFLLLGDKRIEDYQGPISKTLWAHGEYQYSDKLQLDYVIGEDQNRHKLGGQVSYQFEEALVFTQLLYQTQKLTNEDSNNLWDVLLGYDQQVTAKWHVRFEGGYQKPNRILNSPSDFERFLPTEYFAAFANIYEIHPLVTVNATIINDIKSGFTYFIGKGTYSASKNIELDHFIFLPLATGSEPENLAQKLVTLDIGMALRAFF